MSWHGTLCLRSSLSSILARSTLSWNATLFSCPWFVWFETLWSKKDWWSAICYSYLFLVKQTFLSSLLSVKIWVRCIKNWWSEALDALGCCLCQCALPPFFLVLYICCSIILFYAYAKYYLFTFAMWFGLATWLYADWFAQVDVALMSQVDVWDLALKC